MALPRLFPGSISSLVPDEWNSEGIRENRRKVFNRDLLGASELQVVHTEKSAWIAGRSFGRLRVLMEDAFYGWIVWD